MTDEYCKMPASCTPEQMAVWESIIGECVTDVRWIGDGVFSARLQGIVHSVDIKAEVVDCSNCSCTTFCMFPH